MRRPQCALGSCLLPSPLSGPDPYGFGQRATQSVCRDAETGILSPELRPGIGPRRTAISGIAKSAGNAGHRVLASCIAALLSELAPELAPELEGHRNAVCGKAACTVR
jgi:hypothetical protein